MRFSGVCADVERHPETPAGHAEVVPTLGDPRMPAVRLARVGGGLRVASAGHEVGTDCKVNVSVARGG